MAIYDLDGIEIFRAYDYTGKMIEAAYDLSGNKIFDIPYSLTNVKSYFQDSVLQLCENLHVNSQKDLEHILFITDPHGTKKDQNGYGNMQNSQSAALYLLNNAPVSMLVFGGDYALSSLWNSSTSSWDSTEFDSYMGKFIASPSKSKMYALMGNHETYPTSSVASANAKKKIYNTFLADKSLGSGSNPQEVYYYFDNQDLKTRYMFINTSDYLQYTMSKTQLAWIKKNVTETFPDKTWSLLVFGHVNLSNMAVNNDVMTKSTETNGSDILNAISSCPGTVIGYICGHQHIDKRAKSSGIWQTTLMCDKYELFDYYPGISYSQRSLNTPGTVNEQAITLITIDRSNTQVRFRRIGCPIGFDNGSIDHLNYNYGG